MESLNAVSLLIKDCPQNERFVELNLYHRSANEYWRDSGERAVVEETNRIQTTKACVENPFPLPHFLFSLSSSLPHTFNQLQQRSGLSSYVHILREQRGLCPV